MLCQRSCTPNGSDLQWGSTLMQLQQPVQELNLIPNASEQKWCKNLLAAWPRRHFQTPALSRRIRSHTKCFWLQKMLCQGISPFLSSSPGRLASPSQGAQNPCLPHCWVGSRAAGDISLLLAPLTEKETSPSFLLLWLNAWNTYTKGQAPPKSSTSSWALKGKTD